MAKVLMSGNEAIVEAAVHAGLRLYASYPITPASDIMLAVLKKDIGFIQAEDEIAAINMCIGASLAGMKSMTGTSGPGFSLMQEGIGFSYMIEAPLLIINSQRVGPSTGMPTVGSQGDILQAKHGSHGDYQSLVFYPNSVEELYKITIHAINASEEAKMPVILLSDGTLSRMAETIDFEKLKNEKIELKKRAIEPLGNLKRHFTGLISKNGIPDTKNSENYRDWYANRKKQILGVVKKYNFYEFYGNKSSDSLLIAYGITSRVVSELKDEFAIFRPIRLFPILDELKEAAKNYEKIVVIEMNDGQYKGEVEGFLKRDVKCISLLGGKISIEEVRDELKKIR